MSEQFYTAICEQCGILFRENPGRCPDCGSDEILVLSACDGELLVLADNPEIKIDQTWWNEEQKRFHRLLRLFWDDLDRLKSIDGTLLSGTKTTEAESEALTVAKRWLTNYQLENYASSLAGIRLRQALNLVTARLRGDAGVPDSASLREMVASLSGGAGVPNSLIPILEAERDARVRSEEAEQARRDTWRELEKAVAVTRDMLALVASIRETWNTRPLSLGEALDASPIPGEAKLPVLDAWRSWEKARSVESDGNAALGTLERELAALPVSPERTAFDETGIELHPVDGVPGIFDVAAALNARGDRMREFADWENDEPKLEDVPVPNTARPSIPEDVNLKRHATENVLSAASLPVAFLFRNAKYWAIVGGVLFLAFWWIPPLGRWAYGEDESFWRAAFWMFLEFFGPLLAFVWRWHREEIERMRLYSEWADKTVGDRLSELERTHSASGDLTELLAELSKKRSWAKSVTKDSIRIVKETQGFRTLPDWLSDAEERSKNIKARFFKTWEDVLDAVAAAATLEDRKSELARRTAVWRERGEALAARRRETLELLRTAVESTSGQIAAKRETLETATKSAAATVDAALSAFSAWTETADSKAEKARAVAEGAIREADQARRAWVDAKAATDAAVAKEEEKEKRRVEARIEFARLKERTVPAIRAKLERIRLSGDVTKALFERIVSVESELASWEARKDPLPDGIPAERHFAEEADGRAAAFEREWIGLRHARADKRLGAAAKAFGGGRLDDCIAAADECLALEPGRGEAEELRRKAIEAIESREKEIEDWKTDAAEKIQNVHPGSDEPSRSVYEKMTECNERLRSFSSWKDRGRAYNEYNHICGGVRILEGIGQIAEAREAFRKRKAEAEESAKAWRVCIPETLYPASARSSDEVWKRADSEAARGATESAKTEYERAARCAEDALRDWKKVVPDAYLAMARAADKPRGSNRLSRWIAQTVLDSSDVAIFKPLKNPETWTGEFACPWMPEGLFERFVSLPRPRDVLFAMGDPKAAGEWLADLFRFFEEASRIGSPAGWRRDQEVENHRKTLEEDTRNLMVGMAMRQDELLGRMHENIAWFKAAEPIREAREARREAADGVERAGRLGTLSEEVRRSFDSRLEEVAELVGQSQWEKARQKATEIRNDAENRIKAFSVERETKRSNAFRNWLERNPCISRDGLEALGEILRSPPFDAVAELPERRSLSIRLLGRCQDHALVRLMQDDGSIDADLLAEAVRVVLDAPEPKLVDWFQTMPTAELQWNVGMHSPRTGKLNRLLWRRSAESGFPQGRSSWRWLQQHDLVAP